MAETFAFDRERKSRSSEHPYQRECRKKIVERLDPDRPVLLHLATGGGKTLVANNAVKEVLEERGGYALWVTKDWWLLHQAALDMAKRHEGMEDRLRRIGGEDRDLAELPELSVEEAATGVVYTTLHTFMSRLNNDRLPVRGPSLIVWDECHWGYSAKTGRALRRWGREGRVPMLGLTATPPGGESDFEPACVHTFAELQARGHLAKPEIVAVPTSARWHPVRRWSQVDAGDFTEESLRQLAENGRRNEEIVRQYLGGADKYGKTIVFACDITHADRLAKLFCDEGVAAACVHSRLTRDENEANLGDFREGRVRVLVNVVKMTHGVDVPDTKTVFLCRPTASCVLLSQMIGRGARVDERTGKKSFYIVEFIDMADQMENIRHARDCLGSPAGRGSSGSSRRAPPLPFDRTGSPLWTGDAEDLPDAAKNLWFRVGQAFSVAFELTSREDRLAGEGVRVDNERWERVANGLRLALRREFGAERVAVGAANGETAVRKWEVVPDEVGWRVVSPALFGREGMVELDSACGALARAIEDLGVWIDYRTGTEVRLGWLPAPADAIRAVKWTHMLEPVLRSLVRPSRFARYVAEEDRYETDRPNEDCLPVADVYPLDELDEETSLEDLRWMAGDRTASLSLAPLLDDPAHVEVRLLGGTTDSVRLLRWLTLWMRILWAAEKDKDRGRLTDDMLDDPAAYFPALSVRRAIKLIDVPGEADDFVEWLEERQHQVFELWQQRPELQGWLPSAESGRTFERVAPPIRATLEEHGMEWSDSFVEMSLESQRCAIWCVLSGEGALARDERSTVDLVARRLRDQGLAHYRTLRKDGPLYEAIRGVFEAASQAGDGWLEWPKGPSKRVRGYRPVADMAMPDWCDCIVRTMRDWYPDGAGAREWVVRDAFEMARDRYGIQTAGDTPCEIITQKIRERIEAAVDRCLADGYVGRSGSEGMVLECDYSEQGASQGLP